MLTREHVAFFAPAQSEVAVLVRRTYSALHARDFPKLMKIAPVRSGHDDADRGTARDLNRESKSPDPPAAAGPQESADREPPESADSPVVERIEPSLTPRAAAERQARREREAAALRENLRKRKDQARLRRT
jgi:hypothetical protein